MTPIFPVMPFALDMNLGRAYNEAMSLAPEDAWLVFLDHDMMLTTREWFRQIEEAIRFKPDAGAFVACANRIAPEWQKAGPVNIHEIRHHRSFGKERLKVRTLLDVTDTKGFGGVLFAVSKASWREVGGFRDGMLCVDHGMHFALRDAGKRIYLIEGLYVYHWRRAFGDELPEETPRVADCPCRGPEAMPTERLTLPERI